MNSYDLLVACEKLGAHTVEVKESDALREKPMTGVANTTERNTVQCFLGGGYGEEDCLAARRRAGTVLKPDPVEALFCRIVAWVIFACLHKSAHILHKKSRLSSVFLCFYVQTMHSVQNQVVRCFVKISYFRKI